MKPPRIAVTMGDPAGIGPEICLHLLNNPEVATHCVPIVFGDACVLQRVAQKINVPLTAPIIAKADWPLQFRQVSKPSVLNLGCVDGNSIEPGRVDAHCGEAAFQYVIAGINAGLAGEVSAVSTAPLNKEAMHAAGHKYPGHTEIFAERMRAARSCMMLTAPEITCSFVTVHVGLAEVSRLLSVERILEVIELTHEALRKMRGREPKLVACGLNPHAGENGLFGEREEERFIAPAIAAARGRGINIEGPLPADTAFLAPRRRTTDGYICMYHDQGNMSS